MNALFENVCEPSKLGSRTVMLPIRAVDGKDVAKCMLKIGKNNNVIAWNLEMHASVCAVFGDAANFLITNEPREVGYDIERGRNEQQKTVESWIWNIMWLRMTPASQNIVKAEPGYEAACNAKDCVVLWELIRRTHITHVYDATEQRMLLNRHMQESKFHALKQGDRESIDSFKARYDDQIEFNKAVGVPEMDQPRLALDFLYKLDLKRHGRMLVDLSNSALLRPLNAYPETLGSAYRMASGWPSHYIDGDYVTADSIIARVTKSRDTDKQRRNRMPK